MGLVGWGGVGVWGDGHGVVVVGLCGGNGGVDVRAGAVDAFPALVGSG